MPKKSSPDLFDLIRSLSKSEKRYFKIYTTKNKYSDEKQYIKLFDLIDKQTYYDEAKLMKKVPEIKKFSVVKNQLHNLILKAVSSLHSEKKITMNLRSKLDYVEILYHKGLYSQAKKLLSKSKKGAYIYEEYNIILEMLNIEHKLLTNAMAFKSIQKYAENVDSWSNEKSLVIEKVDNIRTLQTLLTPFVKIYFEGIQHRDEETLKFIESLVANPVLHSIDNCTSITAKLTYHLIWAIYYGAMHNDIEAYNHSKTRLKLLEDNPVFIEKDFSIYIYTIKMALDNSIKLLKHNEIESLMQKLDDAVNNSPVGYDQNDETAVFITKNLAYFDYSKTQHDYQAILDKEVEILDGIDRLNEMLNPGVQIELIYYLAYAHFCKGNYQSALKYVNQILNDRFTGVQSDVFNITRILNLIVHYEKGNTDLTDYIAKSYIRTLDKKNVYYDIDHAIIQLVTKLSFSNLENEKKPHFLDFRDYLMSIQFKLENLKLYKYFDVDVWVESKIRGMSIEDLQKLKKK